MLTLLIDGDIVAYRTATSVGDDESLIYKRINTMLVNIQATFESEKYKIFLTGKDKINFRKIINPDYKAHRDTKEKPYWLPLCNEYLHAGWDAQYIHGAEADDALGWNQTSTTVICTIDKDLDQVPGLHYNFVKDITYTVTPHEAIQNFYKQMIIGDASDNIFGIQGLGPVKAAKLIDVLETEQEMFDVVYNKYNDPKRFVMNACCLWIQQQKDVTWAHLQHLILPDQCQQEVDLILNCMKSFMEDT